MLQLIKLAYRNVFRYKRRTIITFCTVSLGLALLIISISLLNGIDNQARNNIIDSQLAHLTIYSQGYYKEKDDLPLNITIKEEEIGKIRQQLKNIPHFKAAEARILFPASLIKGMEELPLMGVGIEPEIDPELFDIKENLVEGNWLEPGENKILVGRELANDMHLSVGDLVTVRMIVSTKEEFAWNALDLVIKGIFDTSNPNVNSQFLILPLSQAQKGLSMKSEITEIVLRLDSGDNTQAELNSAKKDIAAIIKEKNLNLEVFTWKDLAGTFLTLSQFKSERSVMVVLIMLFIASMGIINTMLMAVLERTREIGMLKAMGMKIADIKKLFIFEGGFIGILGSLIGCIIGGLAGWILEVKGMPLGAGESLKEIMASVYPLKDVMYADLTVDVLILAFVLGTGISVIASVYPASKAVKINPAKALKHI